VPEARRIEPVDLEEEMKSSFLDYAMSVIVARALPDVRDGLKPVHRRILWGAYEEGIRAGENRRKSAYIVGSVLGKYHPHGDTAVYDAMVRLGQDFASRYPLIDGQGNFGSADGDPAAAMRYCVTGDTLVATAGGTVRIDEIVRGAGPDSDTDIDLKVLDRHGDPVRASKLFHSGSHPTLRLVTTGGYQVTGTRNHPLLCLVSVAGVPMLLWKLLEEIRPGDHVVLSRAVDGVVRELVDRERGLVVSHDRIPYLAEYVRGECGRGPAGAWLRSHPIDRVERWERDGEEILARIPSEEVRRVVEPLVGGGYYYATVQSVTDAGVRPVYSLRVDSEDHAFITNGFVSHNTEARLSPLAMELLRDIDKETVDFSPNYDNQTLEPMPLPGRFPNLLANGSSGIAVGMATNIPPHNLGEVIDATIALLNNPELGSEDLMRYIKGPDFPTGAQVMGTAGIRDAYLTGRGSIRVRAKVRIEENRRGGQSIVVTELPYQVSGDRLLVRIGELVKEGRITGISDVNNETSREGTRLVIDVRRDAVPQVVLNQLYKHTQLQDNFGVIMLALVEGVPRLLNLADVLRHYVAHQIAVIVRRTRYELRKAQERAHILEGLLIALDHLDEVINLIRNAASADAARTQLMERYALSEIQATAILDMQLRRLAALERRRIQEEYAELQARIAELKAILEDPSKVRAIVKSELLEVKRRFADARRTEIRPDEGELSIEDLIAAEPVVVTVTRTGYVKRVPLNDYRAQNRGGRGVRGANLKEDDIVQFLFITNTHHWVLFFTNKGRVYRVKVHELPEAARNSRGTYVANVPGAAFQPDEKIAAVLDLDDYHDDRFLVLGTRHGMVKKTPLPEYDSPRVGLAAITLRDDDELIGVKLTSGTDEMLFVSRKGQAVRFSEDPASVRPMGRQTSGVIAMRLNGDDEVLAMEVVRPDADLLVITDAGFGKRTPLEQYPRKGRGGKGVQTAKITEARGFLAGALVVQGDDDIFLITDNGQIIRTRAKEVRRAGRSTQGVRVMRLGVTGRVAAVAPVVKVEE
jgi:DNA gyrase subunit A